MDEVLLDIDTELDLEEEARILDAVGLDEDLVPFTTQTPDWVRMCGIMNGEAIEDDND